MEPKQVMVELQKPFPAEDIEFRVSHAVKGQNGAKALILAYVTNRAIMERLDEVFGVNGWKNEYQEWRDKGVLCTISCKVESEWVSKSDGADTTDMEATKGGFSASMKRTAVQWGIGRYLYNLEDLWVPVKDRGQKYIKTQTKQREEIKGYWDVPKLPTWALPEGYVQRIKEQTQEEIPLHESESDQPAEMDSDLAAIEQASNERFPKTAQIVTDGEKPKSGGGMKRVLDLRTQLGMDWKALNSIASTVLGREVKYPLKDNVKSEEEWKLIEAVLLEAKAS